MDNPATPSPRAINSRQRLGIIGGLSLVVLALIGIALRAQIASLFGPPVPPPPCGLSSLQIGSAKFRIQNLAASTDKDLGIPASKPGVAFWMQGTTTHYVFGLSPTADNRALQRQIAKGAPIKVGWGDCSSDDFVVASVGKTIPEAAALMDQSQPGMSIIMPQASGLDGWVVEGQRPEALITSVPETPNPNAIQSEISFLDQSTSADGKTLSLKLAIKNTGSNVIHLSQDAISLTVGNAPPLAPKSEDVTLPIDIQPGATQAITLTFAKPAGNTAVFKILDFSVDLYF